MESKPNEFLINNQQLKFNADVINFYINMALDDGTITTWLTGPEKDIFMFIHKLHMEIDRDAALFCDHAKTLFDNVDSIDTLTAFSMFKTFILNKYNKFIKKDDEHVE